MLNKIVMMGRLVADPEIKESNKKHVVEIRIASDRDYLDKDGVRPTDYVSVVAWEQRADVIGQYFKKGDPIIIEGRLVYEEYTKDGQKRSVHKIKAENIYFVKTKKESQAAVMESAPAPSDNDDPFADDNPFA